MKNLPLVAFAIASATVGFLIGRVGEDGRSAKLVEKMTVAERAHAKRINVVHDQAFDACRASARRMEQEQAELRRKTDDQERECGLATAMLLERQCKEAKASLAWPKIARGEKFTFTGARPIECAAGSTPWAQCWAEGVGACVPGAKP
jgi:hypothetical protein